MRGGFELEPGGRERPRLRAGHASRPRTPGAPGRPRTARGCALSQYSLARKLDGRVSGDVVGVLGAVLRREPGSTIRLADLEHHLKGAESLERKIHDEAIIQNISYAQAADAVKDSLRYTFVVEARDFAKMVNLVFDEIEARGHAVRRDRVKNYFVKGNRYKGVVAHIDLPAQGDGPGITWEIQFHTEASLQVKHDTHDLYKRFRDVGLPLEERRAAYDAIVAASQAVTHPPGLAGFTNRVFPTERP